MNNILNYPALKNKVFIAVARGIGGKTNAVGNQSMIDGLQEIFRDAKEDQLNGYLGEMEKEGFIIRMEITDFDGASQAESVHYYWRLTGRGLEFLNRWIRNGDKKKI